MSKSQPSDVIASASRYRFGLRWMLVVLSVFAVPCSWFASECLQTTRQTHGIRELAQLDVRVREREPTGLGFLVKKFVQQNENWLLANINENWLVRPRTLVSWSMTDEQVPKVIDLINTTGGIHELHVEESPLSAQGLASLKTSLPKVAVLTRSELVNRPRSGERFAAPALQYAAIVGACAVSLLIVLLWPLRARRKRKSPSHALP